MTYSLAQTLCPRFGLLCSIKRRVLDIDFQLKVVAPKSSYIKAHASKERAVLLQMVAQLDSNPLIPHDRYKAIRKSFNARGDAPRHLGGIFGEYACRTSNGLEDVEVLCYERARHRARKSKYLDYVYRIERETEDAVDNGWYPIFQTLTVTDNYYREVFTKGSRAWGNYIRDFERMIGRCLYRTVREAEAARSSGDLFHKYFAVVEAGKQAGRLHIHVLHLCKALPNKVLADPNLGSRLPLFRECRGLRHLWKYGNMTPIAVRLSGLDPFGRLGWRWPVEMVGDKYQPVEAKPVLALARYIAKYVNEAYLQENKREFFRCRMTRNFGVRQIRSFVKRRSDHELEMLTEIQDQRPFQVLGQMTVPLTLMRREALRERLSRYSTEMQWTYVRGLQPQAGLIERLRSMMRMTSHRRRQSTSHSAIRTLQEEVVYEVGYCYGGLRKEWLEHVRYGKPNHGSRGDPAICA